MADNYFPLRPESNPMIYAYSDNNPRYKGLLKVGYTSIDINKRVEQQYPTKRPGGVPYQIVFRRSAIRQDGSTFTDHDVHRYLINMGKRNPAGEWFECTVSDLKAACIAVERREQNVENRTKDFVMRPEQEEAVVKAMDYYASAKEEFPDRAPKFLWNAKMRFGKTFASYQLARKMNLSRVLVLTFKPAVESAWEEDLLTHIDFEGWQFISRNSDLSFEDIDQNRPLVCFGSFQDFLGTNDAGGIKVKNEWVHKTKWDLVIFDEYHFGAWRENARRLFDRENEDEYDSFDPEKYQQEEAGNAINETFIPIETDYYLFLSGTPFRALNSGEFIEDQIYNWTYSDEQRAKEKWQNISNSPYAELPKMIMLTYRLPEEVMRIASQGEFNEFDLNVFFSAEGKGNEARFIYEDYVQKWLDLIRGAYLPSSVDDLKLGANKRPPMPYSDRNLLSILTHTLWFLPNVASCYAMANLLKQRNNTFYHDYTINIAAGPAAGVGLKALGPVRRSMENPLHTKTITLSCGKLTTGVTIKPWSGIFMLRNLSSPETYFQAAFRVQSPWVIDDDEGGKKILKETCYVFDFALDRALKQIADYSCRLNVEESNPEIKVGEFIHFLPVLAYDGSTMKRINPGEVLDIAMAGTSATLLAKRWESALLVNVDNDTLARILATPEAIEALSKIEGFRSLNIQNDLETIINKSEKVRKIKRDKEGKLSVKERKELTDEEKEFKNKRKEVQEKLIKFATRIPIFMYLTDFREYSLKDVITQIEPNLFKKVTGLEVKDFELLVSLNVFNGPLMNDAVYKFKRYEDSSLTYTGINRHKGEKVGGWDTVISYEDYLRLQQNSMVAPNIESAVMNKPNTGTNPNHVAKAKTKHKSPENTNGKVARIEHKVTEIPKREVYEDNKFQRYSGRMLQAAEKYESKKSNQNTIKIEKGSSVNHRRFGQGEILEITDNLILVKFKSGEKRFEYPSAFENGFLTTLED